MKIEKRASGNYRIRKMYNGQMYTVSFDHKPTQKEAMQAMAAELNNVQTKHESMTFRAAAEKYMASKRNILSPSTIRGYATIIKQIPETFLAKNIYDITALDVQEEINRMAEKCSPKTVRNHHGFLSAVLSAFYPDLWKLQIKFRNRDTYTKVTRERSPNFCHQHRKILICRTFQSISSGTTLHLK